MSEPTTPTGKRLGWVSGGYCTVDATSEDILAIEREAAAAERERLARKAGTSRTAADISVFLNWLFAEPTDD